MQTLIVFSHLRWDFVYQRPQHLLSRLAKHYRVLFLEEPVRGKQTPFLLRLAPCPNVEVLRPHTTEDAVGFHDDQFPELTHLLAEYLRDFSIEDYLVWFYTPMALPLLAELSPQAVVYDCMDDPPSFQSAPRQILQREKALLKRAQLVLTGGPTLYEAKRRLHDNVRCFPSAADVEHFSPHRVRSDERDGSSHKEEDAECRSERTWDRTVSEIRKELDAVLQLRHDSPRLINVATACAASPERSRDAANRSDCQFEPNIATLRIQTDYPQVSV